MDNLGFSVSEERTFFGLLQLVISCPVTNEGRFSDEWYVQFDSIARFVVVLCI